MSCIQTPQAGLLLYVDARKTKFVGKGCKTLIEKKKTSLSRWVGSGTSVGRVAKTSYSNDPLGTRA